MLAFLGSQASERKLRLLLCACARRLFQFLLDAPLRNAVTAGEHRADAVLKPSRCRAAALRAAVALSRLNDLHNDAAAQLVGWQPGGWEPQHAVWGGEENDFDDEFTQVVEQRLAREGSVVRSGPPGLDLARATAAAVAFVVAFRGTKGFPGQYALHFARSAVGFAGFPPDFVASEPFPEWVSDPTEAAGQADLVREVFGNPFRSLEVDPKWRTPTIHGLARTVYLERQMPAGTFDRERLGVLADALEDAGCALSLVAHLRSQGLHPRGCWVLDLILGKD
jgi:hypothetical protein